MKDSTEYAQAQVLKVITREGGFQFCSSGLLFQKRNQENQEGNKNMIGPDFVDDIECGSFFDHIDDFLDFPTEDVTVPLPSDAVGNCDSLPDIWNPVSDSLPGSDSVFSDHSASDLPASLSVPYEDIVQLEWMSKFVEDSFTGGSLTMKKEDMSSDDVNKESGHQHFQTSSPVSVLESSTSCSEEKPSGCSPEVLVLGRCGRARSKRPRSRPATFSHRPAIQLISTVSETAWPFVSPKASSDAEKFAGSRPVVKLPQHVSTEHTKKKKKIKHSLPLASLETNQNSPSQAVRKCMHCEITKTPQWRAGPLGPKTLCNACGVRYKSGRLFPEYRPAASPTFVSSIHSNSHKKVLEMRNKNKENTALDSNAFPELIPNSNSSLTLDYI